MLSLKTCVLALAFPVFMSAATTYTVTVDVFEDGDDNLILTGNTLSWGHLDLFANGGANCQDAGCSGGVKTETNYAGSSQAVTNPDILVSVTDSGTPANNFTNHSWYNGIQGNKCTSDGSGGTLNCSATANGYIAPSSFNFTLPFSLGTATSISITTLNCGGSGNATCAGGDSSPTISQQPTAGNGHTAIVYLDDVPNGGANEFKVQLSWTGTSSPVPEPTTALLAGAGLLALGLLTRARRRTAQRLA